MNVGDFLVQRLSEWGVRRIYGYPGDGINGIMGALARAEDRMEFVQVRHEYVHMVAEPSQVRHLVDRALRIAHAERTVTCLIVPNDIQTMEAVEQPEHAHGTIHSSIGYVRPRALPHQDDLAGAAEVLNAG